jgi:DNA polymerase-1
MFLIDGSNHAFRVHFALPPMHDSTGFPTRALYGFTTLLAKMVRVNQPDYLVVAFDVGATFRNALLPTYKGHRPDMPEDLRQQWPLLPGLIEAFGYRCIGLQGWEADDVLGTLARRFAGPDLEAVLVTGDRDFFQLVGDHIHVYDAMKEEEIHRAEVIERMGVAPEHITDLKGLSGDSSDNLPGIPGVGEKTAAKWLQQYGDLEGVIAAAEKIGGKRGQALTDNADVARLSKQLATIALDAPLADTLEDLLPKGMQEERLRELFDQYDFGKVARKLLPERPTVVTDGYRVIKDEAALSAMIDAIVSAGRLALDLDRSAGPVVGASLCWGAADAVYLPLDARPGTAISAERGWAAIRQVVLDPAIRRIAHDSKALIAELERAGILGATFAGDLMLMDYVLAAHERGHSLEAQATRHLGHTMTVPETGGAMLFARPLDETARLGAERAHVTWLLEERLQRRLDANTRSVYETIELPLVPVLLDMERSGIGVALGTLDGIRVDLQARLAEIEALCHSLRGGPFNIASRHEVAEALFGDEAGFVGTKKVKDGFSTDNSVLEKLIDGENLPWAIIEWRHLQKLLGTYVDKLPSYVAADGRIHTSFNQAVAATGRLSSTEPNLQNIPIRTFEGRRIREAFVPASGSLFLSADYSQIELRILAHLTEEDALIQSFLRGEDIHRRTASEVFDIEIDEVTFDQRNAAKAINFGLMYGMSSFRLAGDLQISRDEANRYMEEYFGRFPKIISWLEATREAARKQGFVETLYGRRRVLPSMHAANYSERMAAQREAVNSRVQGTAADIIKIAMIQVHDMLRAEGFEARLLLQVHDELLLEVPEREVERLRPRVVEVMEGAAKLYVPLAVNAAVGRSWNDAHG